MPRQPSTGTPRCHGAVPASWACQRCQMFGRSQAEVPGAGRTAQLPAAPQHLACPAAACVHGIAILLQGWQLLLCLPAARLPPASPCWLGELLDCARSVLVSLCLSLLTLWHQHLRFSAQYFAVSTLGCAGSGIQTWWPRWSLTNSLLSLCSEYLFCWSMPKQILYITGINQVKYQLFFLHQ